MKNVLFRFIVPMSSNNNIVVDGLQDIKLKKLKLIFHCHKTIFIKQHLAMNIFFGKLT